MRLFLLGVLLACGAPPPPAPPAAAALRENPYGRDLRLRGFAWSPTAARYRDQVLGDYYPTQNWLAAAVGRTAREVDWVPFIGGSTP